MRSTAIGPLPAEWRVGAVGDHFEIQLGKMLSPSARRGISPRPYLRNANVQWGSFDLEVVSEMDFDEREAEKFRLEPGDVLVCEGGEPGRTAIWQGQIERCSYQKALHRLRPKSGIVVPEFFAFWMEAALRVLKLNIASGVRTTIAHLPAVRLASLPMPIPTEHEQNAIAEALGRLRARAATEERRVNTLKSLRAVTMAKLFRDGMRGERLKQTEIGEVPCTWGVERFDQLAVLQRGFDLPSHSRRPGVIPVVGSNGTVGRHDQAMAHGPGVAIGRSGTLGGSVFVESDFWPLNTCLFVSNFRGNSPLFVHYFFERFDFKRFAGGASVPTLNRNLVHESLVAIPPLDEQIEIARSLLPLDRRISRSEIVRQRQEELLRRSLADLMTGAVRLPEFRDG